MEQKITESGISILERAKTAKPYTREEMCTFDGEEDLARILATMEQHLKKLEEQKTATRKTTEKS